MLLQITWSVDPDFINATLPVVGHITVRWYGLMWALGFVLGYFVESRIYKRELVDASGASLMASDGKRPLYEEMMESLLMYMMIGTVVGARIGHCFFYDWEYYIANLHKVLFVWEGGLSSHGGAFGILTAMWLFRSKIKKSYIWILDRIVIAVAICGACIRLGNLFNHEIYGHPTDVPWAFEFIVNIHQWQNGASPIYSEPSHPTQIYEILYCVITFGVLMYLYWKTNAREHEGLLFGVFLIGVFFTRFLLEFIKENQVYFEDDMFLNMGQILSIPFFVVGFYLLAKNVKNLKMLK